MKKNVLKLVQTGRKLMKYPSKMWLYILREAKELKNRQHISDEWKKLRMDKKQLEEIKKNLKEKTLKKDTAASSQEDYLLNSIIEETREKNRNNVTRTAAYLDFFLKNRGVHWALLAHMVSRNGGWNMTDLKGSVVSGLLGEQDKKEYFMFLERANAAIFRDAYPQLLLYEASKKQSRELFKLLPNAGVSEFMIPFWEHFYKTGDSKTLTVALIINEQYNIEVPVVQDSGYQEKVLQSWQYVVQETLRFSRVIFPYRIADNQVRLAGQYVEQFSNVDKRIELGKRLYGILFGIPSIHEKIIKYAAGVPHTGSRADFWPHMFTEKKYKSNKNIWHDCAEAEEPFLYSPRLADAWKDVEHENLTGENWFKKEQEMVFRHFSRTKTPASFDQTNEYCLDLYELSLIGSTRRNEKGK
ncbi:DUF2515 family protein [Evansella clarkii]|uniref:DUF2515 family protein n=1 Tax=Evansella clarkii TaxID=79879 RepID=UPI000B436735|nr:DUF2515 family protein [Evansella clarkii]